MGHEGPFIQIHCVMVERIVIDPYSLRNYCQLVGQLKHDFQKTVGKCRPLQTCYWQRTLDRFLKRIKFCVKISRSSKIEYRKKSIFYVIAGFLNF